MDPESKKNLIILGFESDINEIPKMKIVLKMWRKRAKVCHPDKEGGMKEEFQKLQEALKKAGDIIKRMTKVDEEEICSISKRRTQVVILKIRSQANGMECA